VLLRRLCASDNSCLFSSVAYGLYQRRDQNKELRKVVADAVLADEMTFSEAWLGRPPAEYAAWIQESTSWGGAVELSILSQRFRTTINAGDIQTGRIDRYGDGEFAERLLVLYDGLHYDALAVSPFANAPEELDMTLLRVDAENAAQVDAALAALLAGFKAARAFTDTGTFTLRCSLCQAGVKGEAEAIAHAKATGHQAFGEYH